MPWTVQAGEGEEGSAPREPWWEEGGLGVGPRAPAPRGHLGDSLLELCVRPPRSTFDLHIAHAQHRAWVCLIISEAVLQSTTLEGVQRKVKRAENGT